MMSGSARSTNLYRIIALNVLSESTSEYNTVFSTCSWWDESANPITMVMYVREGARAGYN